MQIDFPPDASRTPTQIRKISHSLTDRWSLRAHVWPRKHRADFDGEIRENLPPEQAQHAVDLLIGCGPGSLTYDVLAEGGGIEPILFPNHWSHLISSDGDCSAILQNEEDRRRERPFLCPTFGVHYTHLRVGDSPSHPDPDRLIFLGDNQSGGRLGPRVAM